MKLLLEDGSLIHLNLEGYMVKSKTPYEYVIHDGGVDYTELLHRFDIIGVVDGDFKFSCRIIDVFPYTLVVREL